MKLCVAGLPMTVESADVAFFNDRFAAYRREDDRQSRLDIVVRSCEKVLPLPGRVTGEIRNVRTVDLPDGRKGYYTLSKSGQSTVLSVAFAPDYSQAEICLRSTRSHRSFSPTDLEYMYTGAMFRNRLAYGGDGVLHGSALSYRGRGVIFSADSGVGKSTHTGLWRSCFGDAVEIVNDDKPAIRFEQDGVYLYGTPWSGKTDLNCNRRVPLHAIVFLQRGTQNSIRRMEPLESAVQLAEQIPRPYYDEALSTALLDFADRLRQRIPIYLLTCTADPQAVETAFHGLFPQEQYPKKE